MLPSSQPVTLPENRNLWRILFRLSDLFRAVVAQQDDPKNQNTIGRITVNQARIFSYLFHCRDQNLPVHVKSIARDLNVSPAAASQAVDRLVACGLLERTPDPNDRRAVRLSLSPKGEALVLHHEQRSTALLADLLSDVPPSDFAAFARVLASFSDALQSRWQAWIHAKADGALPLSPESPSTDAFPPSPQPFEINHQEPKP